MKRLIILTVSILAFLPIAATAHDVFVPDWRGQEGTTYQHWSFGTNDNPADPEIISNSYGTASAAIAVGSFGSGWLNQLPGMGAQTGYWDIGGSGGRIVLDIDNRPEVMLYKEIRVQVTYFEDITQAPTVSVTGATYTGGQTQLVEHVETGGDWFLTQSIWRIEPSPDHEQIVVTSSSGWGSVVDQIVVDTNSSGCLVHFDDLSNFCTQWLEQGTDLEADLNGDKTVDFRDFAIFAGLWLNPCPSEWPWP